MSNNPKPWIELVHLHPDVLKENASTDIFALDLGPLADGSGTVAPVYRDAESFFRASWVTAGLKSLLGLIRSSNTLVLRSGAESATFNDPIVTIGRDPTNAYVIEQTDVSRWHCIVLNFRGDVWLYDLNSTHGTAVDGQRLDKRTRIDGVHEIKASGAALTIVSEEGRLL